MMGKWIVENKLPVILAETGTRQTYLVEKTGLSATTISLIKNGQRPELMNALLIALALDRSVEDIWVLKRVEDC